MELDVVLGRRVRVGRPASRWNEAIRQRIPPRLRLNLKYHCYTQLTATTVWNKHRRESPPR